MSFQFTRNYLNEILFNKNNNNNDDAQVVFGGNVHLLEYEYNFIKRVLIMTYKVSISLFWQLFEYYSTDNENNNSYFVKCLGAYRRDVYHIYAREMFLKVHIGNAFI